MCINILCLWWSFCSSIPTQCRAHMVQGTKMDEWHEKEKTVGGGSKNSSNKWLFSDKWGPKIHTDSFRTSGLGTLFYVMWVSCTTNLCNFMALFIWEYKLQWLHSSHAYLRGGVPTAYSSAALVQICRAREACECTHTSGRCLFAVNWIKVQQEFAHKTVLWLSLLDKWDSSELSQDADLMETVLPLAGLHYIRLHIIQMIYSPTWQRSMD